MSKKMRVQHFATLKQNGQPIVMLTAYDGLTAAIFDKAGVDCLLVGDSLGNVMLGHGSTIPTTLDEIVVATRAVTRATTRAFVVADLPFGSYEADDKQAFASAVRLVKEGGAQAVKMEGGQHILPQVKMLVERGIPVVGHLGFTPQAEHALGGFRVQGREQEQAEQILQDALALQAAGVFMLVLEMVPASLAAEITAKIAVPTIGIGAGIGCDGQVLVWSDMAGMTDWRPKFAKVFGEVGMLIEQTTSEYVNAVRNKSFPQPEHSF